jgi:DNA-binding response OmpR family regulator
MMKTLLCVEDDKILLRNSREFLRQRGYRVLAAETLAQARDWLQKEKPDAVLLDIMLPDGNGLDLLTEIRAAGSKVPIIILTAWGEPKDVSRGYRLGATAYLSKPFEHEAVLAAVEGIFDNMQQVPEEIEKGPLTLQMASMIALLNGVDILLTQKEFALLLLFIQNEGKTMSAEYLYEKVWGQSLNNDTRAVKLQVSNLRTKTEGSGYAIQAVRGAGYRFEFERKK